MDSLVEDRQDTVGIIASTATSDSTQPLIAVVVPVFRHSVFLVDAVESACAQQLDVEFRVVIVDDGCQFQETRLAATVLAFAHPDRVAYVRRSNGGLSAARNTGVRYALARWPSIEAIYFLDADNRIEAKSLAKAFGVLRSDPKIGWIYPDIAMFGSVETIWDYAGRYSVLRHLTENVSEAGSMVRREVFDRGCWYDEDMRQGYEDWEFWWQCIEAGYIGRHAPFFGLRYRKRPESMLTQSEREHAAVLAYMRRKHRQMFRTKRLLALEARDAPRYAIAESLDRIRICTDAHDIRGETIDGPTLAARYVAASQQPQLHTSPRIIVASSSQAAELLGRLRLDRFVLWWMEKQAEDGGGTHFIAVEIAIDHTTNGITTKPMQAEYWPIDKGSVHLLMATPKVMRECLLDNDQSWARSILTTAPHPKTIVLRIEIGESLGGASVLPSAVELWFELFDLMHQLRKQLTPPMPLAKKRSLSANAALGAMPAKILECGALLPLIDPEKRDVCFVLPLVAFGGVEKVALKVAAEFRRLGWRCHLLVLNEKAVLDQHWLDVFDSVVFYREPTMRQWCEDQQFLGTYYPEWATRGDPNWLEGLLLPMDAVINFHAADFYRVAGKLRSKGVALAASLHVNDKSEFGRDAGHNFLALGHEHVLDLLAPCSTSLLEWLHAQGVPADKLVAIPNAPAQDLEPEEIAAVLEKRAARQSAGGPLNVLFLGRLDRQKGLDRLAAIVERCKGLQLPIRWRLVGGSVIDAEASHGLGALCEPPVHDPAAITELYAWADVLLLPSHWEGLPLTILEAARLGVVPLAARVGAVEEAIIHEQTGLLIDNLPLEAFVEAAAGELSHLASAPERLRQLSKQAAQGMTRNWRSACREFIARLEATVARNSKRRER